MDRREFITTSILGSAALSLGSVISCGNNGYLLPKRKLGQTSEILSTIGFGGVLVDNEEQMTANNMIAKAFDRGINYFDVAPTYGNAEEKLGPALKPYRNQCFLACKTTEREKDGAEKELHASLKNLQTDHFDLYQLHAITTEEDVEKTFAPNGAMEVFLKAKQDGKVRYLGFSAHSEKAALLAMKKFDFDTILFPINFVCWFQGDFGPRVISKAIEKKMGILALKSLALTKIPEGTGRPFKKLWYIPVEEDETADLALRFTLGQGTTAAIPPGDARFFWKAVEIAEKYSTLTSEEFELLRQKSKGVEPLFKVT
ncbi:MAG: aldo/keto reductase [Calditrichia bacterium]|jgi:predicted aldo/keto reductase-like oxidoreductase|nr:aldo/keto reductase [Calditrichia bacterium]